MSSAGASMLTQTLPLPLGEVLSIDAGIEAAVHRMLDRRRARPNWYARAAEEERQLNIKFPAPYLNTKNGRPCKYPFEYILYARRLRRFGFTYREIADEVHHKFCVPAPPLWSVRDWVQHWTRVSG